MTISAFGRIAVVALFSAFAAFLAVPKAHAQSDAEAFTQHLIDQGVAILRDTSGGEGARRSKFSAFINQYADARKAALFTLGAYRHGAAPADIEAFVTAFHDYATAVYEAKLGIYKNQSLRVVGSIDNKPGDVTVNTVVDDGKSSGDPLRVAFRLLGSSGNYKFVDVQVEGIWLSIDQQEQFASFLSKNGGSVPALTSYLVDKTQRINAGTEKVG